MAIKRIGGRGPNWPRKAQMIRSNQRSLTAVSPHNANTRFIIPKRNPALTGSDDE